MPSKHQVAGSNPAGIANIMIVCNCRNISTFDYDTNEELINRLKQNDVKCGICLRKFCNVEIIIHDCNCTEKHNNPKPK